MPDKEPSGILTPERAFEKVLAANQKRAAFLSGATYFEETRIMEFLTGRFDEVHSLTKADPHLVLLHFLNYITIPDKGVSVDTLDDFENIEPDCDRYELLGNPELGESSLANELGRIRGLTLLSAKYNKRWEVDLSNSVMEACKDHRSEISDRSVSMDQAVASLRAAIAKISVAPQASTRRRPGTSQRIGIRRIIKSENIIEQLEGFQDQAVEREPSEIEFFDRHIKLNFVMRNILNTDGVTKLFNPN